MQWYERIENYTKQTGFPRSLFIAEDDRVVGTWIMGNDYRVKSGYYGGYPATYLNRIFALFPDKTKVLHLFAGKVDRTIGPVNHTFDVNTDLNPTYQGDATDLSQIVPLKDYDLILADPPYSEEDSEHYGVPLASRNKVMSELESTAPGTHVVWLDQAWPMYRKDMFDLEGVIGLVRSTNHRVRMVFIYRRRESTRPYIRF